MKQAGHAKVDVTYLYTITDRERERQVVERIWERVMGPEGPGKVQ
jgi:chorismate mutase